MSDWQHTAYCGPPPRPEGLWSQWNLDPVLLAVLAAAAVGFFLFGPKGRANRMWFAAAILVLLVAFVSPLCALSSALFSARIGHHLLMTVAAAPLLALAWPRLSGRIPLAAAAALHVATFWLWHAPAAYGWALSGTAAYWVMEATLVAGAVVFWGAVRARRRDAPAVILTLIAVMALMGLLAALITFAQQPMYAPHFGATLAWGLTPLEDQQLAGLIMWAPGALPYFAAVIWAAARWLGLTARGEVAAWRG